MKKHTLAPGVTLFHADCREALRSLPDNSIDAVPCDPPYALNFMGKGLGRHRHRQRPRYGENLGHGRNRI
jgi:DNA modification methylase